jgi:hypothetical protein
MGRKAADGMVRIEANSRKLLNEGLVAVVVEEERAIRRREAREGSDFNLSFYLGSSTLSSPCEDGENLSETNTLVNLAAKEFTDWDLDDLCEYLDGNKGATAVDQEIQSGQQRFGIKGVPFFVVGSDDGSGSSNQKPYAFSGAQTSETFCDIFRELSERK